MISEWIAAILLVLGAFFMLIASIGLVRLKDLYMRMHASTKAPSLGIFLMVMAIIVYFFRFWTSIEGLLIILFIFMTTPIGSHMISRAAHAMGVEKDENTIVDELEDKITSGNKDISRPAGNKTPKH